MKKQHLSHTALKKELLSDPDVLKEYQALSEEFELMEEMLKARMRAGMSQASLAKRMNTTSSAISRLESINNAQRPSPSVATLKKYAHALGCRLSIKLIPESPVCRTSPQGSHPTDV